MRAAVLIQPGVVVVERRPIPEPAPDEVLVRIGSVGICGSDCHYFEHGRIGPYVVEHPIVLGHEAGGEIVAVGSGVPQERVGQRVSVEPQRPCRACDQCKAGRYNLCPAMVFLATPPVDGAFAEYLLVPADFAHVVPPELGMDAAGLLEPLSVALWACAKAGITAGSAVLIAGAGPIGVITAQVARAMGATTVIVSDVSAGRLEWATRFGATAVDDPIADPERDQAVDAFIDASGVPTAVARGIRAVRPGGAVVLVGMGADELVMPVALIQNRELRLTGVFRYANTWPAAVALAASGRVRLDEMVTATRGLDEVADALRLARSPEHMKVVIRP